MYILMRRSLQNCWE